ncbi:hypothetical protein [Runella slithyformis]|uniref:Uncharacterized protein n=1 Tax=Runella slithyformis (strain ATCC 29530 / DSM 19594 / LMG 11500 / NCIMB 11436 / LSU 4) TaxID=761193 RepID=A0A7U4E5C2_RUNSL|nr:hypothetical protein [Runella slithyformis]AEI48303.1 hypothetical protein Runsl_1879 [Runella slithyformis DSM 19594]
MPPKISYRFYPSLLNTYSRFLQGKLREQELLDRINRVPIPSTEAQLRGVSFEDAVLKGIGEDQFDFNIVQTVRRRLPKPIVKTQVYCQYQIGDALIYGFVDVVGRREAVDLKTTAHYEPDRFLQDHQHFYLPALYHWGIRQMRYLITDFEQVYEEIYDGTSDFTGQLEEVYSFKMFLNEHRELITNVKVFGGKR